MEKLPLSAWMSLVLAAAIIMCGLFLLPSLPPTVTILYGFPPIAMGIGLWITATFATEQGAYGDLTSRLPPWIHAVVRTAAAITFAVGILWILKQPGANAAPLERRLNAIQDRCITRDQRVERGLLELLVGIQEALDAGEHADIERRLEPVLRRCRDLTAEAFDDPEGTHRSWRQLRDWMAEHPYGLDPDDPLWQAPHRPLRHQVDLPIELE